MMTATADRDDRFFVQQAFKEQGSGCFLHALTSGHELFQLLKESVDLPALLLLDLNMPVMNGFDVLKRLRANSTYDSVPVVLLTTSDAESDRYTAHELGASNFLTKPPTLEQLTKVIAQLKLDWLHY